MILHPLPGRPSQTKLIWLLSIDLKVSGAANVSEPKQDLHSRQAPLTGRVCSPPGLAAEDHHQPGSVPDAGRLRQPPSGAPGPDGGRELLTAASRCNALVREGSRESCNGVS